jgi:hypothetical protein
VTAFEGLNKIQNGGQVSSSSVWRVTYYDHLCFSFFFRIFAVSMATAAILKKINP